MSKKPSKKPKSDVGGAPARSRRSKSSDYSRSKESDRSDQRSYSRSASSSRSTSSRQDRREREKGGETSRRNQTSSSSSIRSRHDRHHESGGETHRRSSSRSSDSSASCSVKSTASGFCVEHRRWCHREKAQRRREKKLRHPRSVSSLSSDTTLKSTISSEEGGETEDVSNNVRTEPRESKPQAVYHYITDCMEKCAKEGRQCMTDYSGTNHAFKNAKFYLRIEEAFPDRDVGGVIPRPENRGDEVYMEFPAPMEMRQWMYARYLMVSLKPKPQFLTYRAHLKMEGKVVKPSEDNEFVKVLFDLDHVNVPVKTIADLNKYYSTEGVYTLIPVNITYSHLENAEEQLINDCVEYGACEHTRRTSAEIVNVFAGGDFRKITKEGLKCETQTHIDFDQPHLANLNESQRKAVDMIVNNKIGFFQGPPGTGKSTTLAAAVAEIFLNSFLDDIKVIVVASSNAAVDVICQKIVDAVKQGGGEPARKILRYVTKGQRRQSILEQKHLLRDFYGEAQSRVFKTELKECRVLCCLDQVVINKKIKNDFKADVMIVDECTTIHAFKTPVLLSRAGDQIFFAGDFQQLNAVTHNKRLGRCEMERAKEGGAHIHLLNVQYRMHPVLAEFVGEKFYGGALRSHPSVSSNIVDPPFPHYNANFPTVVWNIPAMESRGTLDNLSITNTKQAEMSISVLRSLEGHMDAGMTVLLLTPYAQQKKDCIEAAHKRYGSELPSTLKIQTVDQAQGGESDIVIFVTTRANILCQIGFAGDDKRINVALSRAKRAIIILADVRTFCRNDTWKSFLTRCEENLAIVGGEAEEGGDPLSSFALARRISISEDLEDPLRHSLFVRGVFYQWTLNDLAKAIEDTEFRYAPFVESMPVPEGYSKKDRAFIGGPSGDFYVLVKSDEDVQRWLSFDKLTFRNRDLDRYIEVARLDVELIAKLFYRSKVVLARGFAIRRGGFKELRIALKNMLAGLTIRYMKVVKKEEHRNGTSKIVVVGLLMMNAEQAFAAARRNGILDVYDDVSRRVEFWRCMHKPYCDAFITDAEKAPERNPRDGCL